MGESDKTTITRRLARFLKGPAGRETTPTEPIRKGVVEVLHRATSQSWKTFIVGGAIRDLLLGPPDSWPRDVDLIVDGPSPKELESAFSDLLIRRNSFGGLRLQRSVNLKGISDAKYDLLFDVWCLQDSWGIKAQGLAPTILNFLKTPFLNIDSIAVALTSRSKLIVHEHGFFDAVATKTLEVNNEPNPFPFTCAIRSLLLAAKLDFELGPRLASFIYSLTTAAPVSKLVDAQISHYGQIRCSEDDIKGWLSKLRAQLEGGAKKVRFLNNPQYQTHLWRDWPPHTEPGRDEKIDNATQWKPVEKLRLA